MCEIVWHVCGRTDLRTDRQTDVLTKSTHGSFALVSVSMSVYIVRTCSIMQCTHPRIAARLCMSFPDIGAFMITLIEPRLEKPNGDSVGAHAAHGACIWAALRRRCAATHGLSGSQGGLGQSRCLRLQLRAEDRRTHCALGFPAGLSQDGCQGQVDDAAHEVLQGQFWIALSASAPKRSPESGPGHRKSSRPAACTWQPPPRAAAAWWCSWHRSRGRPALSPSAWGHHLGYFQGGHVKEGL